jgi:hypothetical protein
MIPRVLHWLWLGPDAVPEIFTYYADSWRRFHPSWEIRLWRDDTLSSLSCPDYAQVTSFKTRYDILRLEILRQCGGVIVDMDVEAIRPLDPLLSGVSGFIGRVKANHVGNQVLGAIPHHPFFEAAVARFQAGAGADASSSENVGKAFLTRLLAERPDGMTVFPPETFFFQPSFEPPQRPDDFPGVYAVHHELESYTSPLEEGVIEQAIADLMDLVLASSDVPDPGRLARLKKYERRLRRAVRRQARGYQALFRRVEAQREQAEGRRREAERLVRHSIEPSSPDARPGPE